MKSMLIAIFFLSSSFAVAATPGARTVLSCSEKYNEFTITVDDDNTVAIESSPYGTGLLYGNNDGVRLRTFNRTQNIVTFNNASVGTSPGTVEMVFKDKAATKIVVTLTDDDGGVAVTLSSTDKALLQSLKKGLQVDTDSGVLSFSSASACKLSL